MYTYRMGLMGALMMLSACSMAPPRPHAAAVTGPIAAAPAPAPLVAATSKVVPAPAASALQPAPAPLSATPVPAAIAAPVAVAAPAHPLMSPHPVPKLAPAKKAAAAAIAAPAQATLQVSGHVMLKPARGQQIEAGEQADTLVYFVPVSGGSRARPGHYTVYTHNRDFSPESLAVPLGSTVSFVNLDDVRHNVFSVTPGSAFDLGYQGSGEKADHAFGHAGIVLVSCNVHHSMELDVLVVPSPYMVKVGADGNFTLAGLPKGPGTLYFWNPRAQLVSQKVTLPMGAAVSQQILAVRPRLTTALNAGEQP
ncbi:hypothetical protein PY254_14660 [Rhodanobacter sp. AS-Z3]|uniref:cupredoxin domain-containing protein n=1 Tax=Rhodanobacter sp. AS-Z3 TaxID=3031330 RepID=UPI00247A4920|nr:hypothetical protein [Rhodanobacter sp. AS-Z3]WEN14461.1 hypothetical protein PY254_14660 [Rhodanobacter sp. AS-Z3]